MPHLYRSANAGRRSVKYFLYHIFFTIRGCSVDTEIKPRILEIIRFFVMGQNIPGIFYTPYIVINQIVVACAIGDARRIA